MIVWPATRADVQRLCREMRQSDRLETQYNAEVTGRITPQWSIERELLEAFEASTFWAVWRQDDLVGLGGVAPLPQDPNVGAIWFLGTHMADSHQLALTLTLRRFIRAERPRWGVLGNVIPQHMVRRRAWLEKLGFDFAPSEANKNTQGLVAFWSHAQDGPDEQPAAP